TEAVVARATGAAIAGAGTRGIAVSSKAAPSRNDRSRIRAGLSPTTSRRGLPVRAQEAVDVEVVRLAAADAKASQATLADEAVPFEQALRPRVVGPDEGVHAIDEILPVDPIEDRGHGAAHQARAPVRP